MRKLIISLPLLVGILIAAAPTTAAAATIGSYDQDSWEESSEIMADAVEALRESGEFNEEADIGAPASSLERKLDHLIAEVQALRSELQKRK